MDSTTGRLAQHAAALRFADLTPEAVGSIGTLLIDSIVVDEHCRKPW